MCAYGWHSFARHSFTNLVNEAHFIENKNVFSKENVQTVV